MANVPLEVFGVRFQLTHTLGKLANFCGDAGEIDKVAEGHVKAFTSGNRMNFDRKGEAPIDATPTARLMVSCNNVPRFSDRTDGIWRRMVLVPFRTKIQPHERIIGMDKREWWEASGELPAIFNWAAAGVGSPARAEAIHGESSSRRGEREFPRRVQPGKGISERILRSFIDRNGCCFDALSDLLRLDQRKWTPPFVRKTIWARSFEMLSVCEESSPRRTRGSKLVL